MQDLNKRTGKRLGLIAVLCALMCLELIGSAAPMRAQASTILSDQFTDNSNNWQLAGKSNTTLNVSNGVLTLGLSKENIVGWATPEITVPDNINVQVDFNVPDSNSTQWSGGIVIRADTRDLIAAFYQFEIEGDGRWNFITRTANGDVYKMQHSGSLKEFDATATNTLKVSASGNTFTFFVNGAQVGTFQDSSINNDPGTEKYAGLLISTFKGLSTLKGEFRNLEITSNDSGNSSGGNVSGTDQATASVTEVSTDEPTIAPTKIATKQPAKTPTKAPTKTGGLPGIKKSPTPTPTEDTSNNNNQSSGNALLQENFSTDNPNGWVLGKNTNKRVALVDNSLAIQILKKSFISWSYPDPTVIQLPADVDLTVAATAINPDPSGEWSIGVGVRAQITDTDEQFYLLEIIGTGEWTFSKVSALNGFTTIVKTKTLPDDFDPTADHTIRVVAIGSHFDFYLDGTKIGQATDKTLKTGDSNPVVLAAGTYANANNIEVDFTNLEVDAPQTNQ